MMFLNNEPPRHRHTTNHLLRLPANPTINNILSLKMVNISLRDIYPPEARE
jgi:hypothetical protein